MCCVVKRVRQLQQREPRFYRVLCALALFTLFMMYFGCLLVFIILPAAYGEQLKPRYHVIAIADEPDSSREEILQENESIHPGSIMDWNSFYFHEKHGVEKNVAKDSVKNMKDDDQENEITTMSTNATENSENNNENDDMKEEEITTESVTVPPTSEENDNFSHEQMQSDNLESKHLFHHQYSHSYHQHDKRLNNHTKHHDFSKNKQKSETIESVLISSTSVETNKPRHNGAPKNERKKIYHYQNYYHHHKGNNRGRSRRKEKIETPKNVEAQEILEIGEDNRARLRNVIRTHEISSTQLTTVAPFIDTHEHHDTTESVPSMDETSVAPSVENANISSVSAPTASNKKRKPDLFVYVYVNAVHRRVKVVPKDASKIRNVTTETVVDATVSPTMTFKSTSIMPCTDRSLYYNHAKLMRMRGRPRNGLRGVSRGMTSSTTMITEVTGETTTSTVSSTTLVSSSTESTSTTTEQPTSSESVPQKTSTTQKVTTQKYIPPRKGYGWRRKAKKATIRTSPAPSTTSTSTTLATTIASERPLPPQTPTQRSKRTRNKNKFKRTRPIYNPFINPSTPKVIPALYFQSIVTIGTNESSTTSKTLSSTIESTNAPTTIRPTTMMSSIDGNNSSVDAGSTTPVADLEISSPGKKRTKHHGMKRRTTTAIPSTELAETTTEMNVMSGDSDVMNTEPIPTINTYKCRTYPSANTWGHHCSLTDVRLDETTDSGIMINSQIPNQMITEIDLGGWSGSSITSLGSDACDTFPNIRFYYATHLGLKKIEVTAFKNCKKLQRLQMSDNELSELPHDIFKENRHLTWIGLGSNKFTSLDPTIFLKAKDLIAIELENNLLQKFHVEAFESFSLLRQLDLRENALADVDEKELFKKFPLLQSIYLCGNENITESRRKKIFEYFDLRNIECDLTINC